MTFLESVSRPARVVAVEHLGDFRLRLTFSDGLARTPKFAPVTSAYGGPFRSRAPRLERPPEQRLVPDSGSSNPSRAAPKRPAPNGLARLTGDTVAAWLR